MSTDGTAPDGFHACLRVTGYPLPAPFYTEGAVEILDMDDATTWLIDEAEAKRLAWAWKTAPRGGDDIRRRVDWYENDQVIVMTLVMDGETTTDGWAARPGDGGFAMSDWPARFGFETNRMDFF